MRFQIGDVIRCVRGAELLGVKQNSCYVVLSVDKDGDPYIKTDNGAEYTLLATRFVLHYRDTQAAAIAGGLQPHSVGELYPLAVVTYANGEGTAIFVENLQEGTVATKVKDVSYPHKFDSHDQALAAIEGGELVFSKGRPHCVASANVWVLYNENNPVRVVRLHNMLHHVD
jgi:hypothetical protein